MKNRNIRSTASVMVVAPIVVLCGCSSLEVKKADGKNDSSGVPFYMLSHEIRVTELGVDEEWKPTPIKPLKIDLVTRIDPNRKYLVNNSPGPLAKSSFALTRRLDGTLQAVSASHTDQVMETAQTLAKVVVGTIAMADEFDELQETRKKLLEDLKTVTSDSNMTPSKRAEAIKKIEDSLALIDRRITTSKPKQKKGTRASKTIAVESVKVVTLEDLQKDKDALKNVRTDTVADKIRVILVETAKQ